MSTTNSLAANGLRQRSTVSSSIRKRARQESELDSRSFNNDHDVGCDDVHVALSTKWQGWYPFMKIFFVGLHLSALLLFIMGFVWRIQLHSGEECDMTYSYRAFLPIDVRSGNTNITNSINAKNHASSLATNYQLFKFIDERDPRYETLQKPRSVIGLKESKIWCAGMRKDNKEPIPPSSAHIVLYIPGHWGSFTQSRSLGAHGNQMTGHAKNVPFRQAYNSLATGQWSGNSSAEQNFVYEVYAVDFNEQGTALHGEYMQAQSAFVAASVEYLVSACDVSSVTLVAHSMGGYVARLTYQAYPKLRPYLKNIVTLATPHSTPLYAFDKSVHDIFEKLNARRIPHVPENNLLVSISGGIRDEMISPKACECATCSTDIFAATVTVSSSELIDRGFLGMDHRAIVWCHGTLHTLRKILWELSIPSSEDSAAQRINQVKKILDAPISARPRESSPNLYGDQLLLLEQRTKEKFGHIKYIGMMSAMLYNLPLLIAMYAVIIGLQWAIAFCCDLHSVPTDGLGCESSVLCCFIVLGTSIAFTEGVRWHTCVTLVFVANSVAWIVPYLISRCIQGRLSYYFHFDGPFLVAAYGIACLFFCFCLVLVIAVVGHVLSGKATVNQISLKQITRFLSWCAFVVIFPLVEVAITERQRNDGNNQEIMHRGREKVMLASLILIVGPCLLAGQVSVALSLSWEEKSSESLLQSIWVASFLQFWPVILYCFASRLKNGGYQKRVDAISQNKEGLETYDDLEKEGGRMWAYACILTISIAMIALYLLPLVLQFGTGFRLAYVVQSVSVLGIARMILPKF